MTESATYEITLERSGPRIGKTASPAEGLTDIEVASPPEFGGPGEKWTPEHLFVASLSSCLMTTFETIAEISGVEIAGYRDSASGLLVRDENRLYRMQSATLRPRIQVKDPGAVDKARRLIEKAKEVCLISRSVTTEVLLEATVEAADEVAVGPGDA